MENKQRWHFVRSFPPELQARLQQETVLWKKLLADVQNGEVFPAIRNREMHFYHKGGRLLAFNQRGFRTNVKYALALHEGFAADGDIREADLHRIAPIPNFPSAYGGMKQLCALYAGWEAAAVAGLYANWPYTLCREKISSGSPEVVVLDIEVSLSRESEEGKRDRIDLVLLDTNSRELLFVEAKLFANGAVRASKKRPPRVVEQIKNYRSQIGLRKAEILEAYQTYTEVMNALCGFAVPAPTSVIEDVPLLIVDFDADQRDGRLMKNIESLQDTHRVCCLDIGKTEGASDRTLKSWFTQVRKFGGRGEPKVLA